MINMILVVNNVALGWTAYSTITGGLTFWHITAGLLFVMLTQYGIQYACRIRARTPVTQALADVYRPFTTQCWGTHIVALCCTTVAILWATASFLATYFSVHYTCEHGQWYLAIPY